MSEQIDYGSICSGIEAASLAWECLDFKPRWFAEIEPFPSAVLAHRWPAVPNLGDMTKLAREVLQRNADWQAAIRLDREIRERDPHAFLHPDCVPLDQADLDDSNGVLFGHSCMSGHCFT